MLKLKTNVYLKFLGVFLMITIFNSFGIESCYAKPSKPTPKQAPTKAAPQPDKAAADKALADQKAAQAAAGTAGSGGRGGQGYQRGGNAAPARTMYPAVCSECGINFEAPFQPSGDRPVYCRDCFERRRTY